MPSPSNQWYRPSGSKRGLLLLRTKQPARSSGSAPATTSRSAVISVWTGS